MTSRPVTFDHPVTFGAYFPQLAMTFDRLVERVQLAERLGFTDVWFMDHFYPPGLPQLPSFDGWTLVAALAPLTERVRLGHLVTANAMRHPALLAKMATGVDVISNGRVNLGIGSGSVALEHEQLGIPFPRASHRSKQLAEAVEIIKTMFTQAVTSFEGEFYHVRDVPNLPQPVQQPNPPIVIGGGGEKFTLSIVARWADVWNCPTYDLAVLEHKIERLRGLCEAIGRDFSTLVLGEQAVLTLVPRRADLDAAQEEARRRYGSGFAPQDGFVGTPEDVIRQLRAKVDLGMRQFAFFFYDRGTPQTLELFAREVLPAFA